MIDEVNSTRVVSNKRSKFWCAQSAKPFYMFRRSFHSLFCYLEGGDCCGLGSLWSGDQEGSFLTMNCTSGRRQRKVCLHLFCHFIKS